MLRWQKFKLICVLFVAVSSAGCAMALADKALGDKKATHANDQIVDTSNPNGNNFSKDVQ